MPVAEVGSPAGWLFRISRGPDPLAWPDRERAGANRFDLPGTSTRVLYAAAERRAAFMEPLARLRPGVDAPYLPGRLPPVRFASRLIVRFRLGSAAMRWLDLMSPATVQALRGELAETLVDLGLTNYDMGDVLSRDRRLTQPIARRAHDHGHGGIHYPSRFDPTAQLWASFEGATFADPEVSTIAADDPDVLEVARLFHLAIDPGPP
jgi:hypothetical protein